MEYTVQEVMKTSSIPRMSLLLIILTGVFTVAGSRSTAIAVQEDNQWHLLVSGKLAVVDIERVLYEKENSPHFFVHLRITNSSVHSIGVDLCHYWEVIYPNQWGIYQEDHPVIDEERRMVDKALVDQRKAEIVTDYQARKLTMIPPGQATDYYRQFNSEGRLEIEKSKSGYFILRMDGRVLLTDGNIVEGVGYILQPAQPESRALVIPVPVIWKVIPSDSRVVAEDSHITAVEKDDKGVKNVEGHEGHSRIYDGVYQKIWETVPKAITKLGPSILSVDEESGTVFAETPMTTFSYGESISVYIKKIDETHTGVEVVSRKKDGRDIFAYSYQDRILNELSRQLGQSYRWPFFQKLGRLLGRSRRQTGHNWGTKS